MQTVVKITVNKKAKCLFVKHLALKSRDEATRTPDPYVPNVVRYQLRYIPILRCKGRLFL